MINLGIMQGRLSPPKGNLIQHFPLNSWEKEFKICKNLGLKSIEWVFENKDHKKNPIYNKKELKNILKQIDKHEVKVNSLVADFFMENKLFNETREKVEKNIEILKLLIDNCKEVGIKTIELPFVDNSSLKTLSNLKETRNNLIPILEICEKKEIFLSLETDLKPEKFKEFIESFFPIKIFVNFDMGNSASLGFNPETEIQTLGNYIINVHIKDRILNGSTVPLGTGAVRFKTVFKKLKEINYSGDFILQTARLDLTNSKKYEKFETTIKKNIDYINQISHD